jgi:AraC family transcriptional regulator of adaptative response / DNA-3-methyladenine glycosylase II
MSENRRIYLKKRVKIVNMRKEQIYFEAMLARDIRFDGKFFVGVKTTGVYCRPICPAKPKQKNVEFFQNHLAAEKAGYRPCLRCRPESAPLSSVWIGKSAIVRRAVKMLSDPETLEMGEERFAELFGVSARHLRRVFIAEIGKTPRQLAAENRLNLARKLIIETHLSMTQIAFASGFKSVRRFNEAFRNRFSKAPSQIRRNPISEESLLTISIPYRPPFYFEGMLHFYKSHQIGYLERFQPGKMFRIISIEGRVGEIGISNDPKNSRLIVDIDFPDISKIHSIILQVRHLFDLDSDPVLIANILELDPKIAVLLKKYPGVRLPSGWDAFEVAIATLLGQFVSISRARGLVAELIELLGEDSGRKIDGRPIKLFPSPAQIATADLSSLKTTTVRKATVKEFARWVYEKKLSLESTQDIERFYEKVTSIHGIGPWTGSYMSMKVLRHTDAFPETDLVLARALDLHPKEVVNRMSPWRAYVAALFWLEYSVGLKNEREKK